MKKIILSAVVAAAAVFGAYTANQTSNEVASLSLMDATDIEAEATPGDGGPTVERHDLGTGSGKIVKGETTKSTYTKEVGGEANVGFKLWGAKANAKRTVTVETSVTYYYCDNSSLTPCQPYYTVTVMEH